MKLIMRADDVGYTKIHNMGTWEVLDHGIATSADVMLDTPGTVDALEHLRSYPWISVGWHIHFWGEPLLSPSEVPSLVNPNGRFRPCLPMAEDVAYVEAYGECLAQMERCVKVLGKAPDYCATVFGDAPMARAVRQVCKDYGIALDFMKDVFDIPSTEMAGTKGTEKPEFPFPSAVLDEKWVDRKIYNPMLGLFRQLMSDSWDEVEGYDPLAYIIQDHGNLLRYQKDETVMVAWHPGYVDYYVLKEGDPSPNARGFITCRPKDVHALCAGEMKEWIADNGVELVNFRDALYGTREYQNHLLAAGNCMAKI